VSNHIIPHAARIEVSPFSVQQRWHTPPNP
jgi:hypothetical protein